MSDPEHGESNRFQDTAVTIQAFQQLIRDMYFEKDDSRGVPATFMWLMEEVKDQLLMY